MTCSTSHRNGLSASTIKATALATTCLVHWTSDLTTKWSDGTSMCVFVKYFMKILKVLQLFIKNFMVNGKYFTSLITLPKKIKKYFFKNNLL